MLRCVILVSCIWWSWVLAMPEPPKFNHQRYGPPPPPPPPPPAPPQKNYLPAQQTAAQHVAASLPIYNAPSAFYGPPPPQPPPPPPASNAEKIITRNIYVHVPPEEPEVYHQPSAPLQTVVPKKHYKIIFIKAPSPPAPIRQELPPPVQDEHKTLVYVLVRRPEEPEPLVLPTPPTTEPSKPEVYFVKYKEQINQPSTQYGLPSASAAAAAAPAPQTQPAQPTIHYGPPSA